MRGAVEYGAKRLQRYYTSRESFAGHAAMKIVGQTNQGNDCEIYVVRVGSKCYSVAAVSDDQEKRKQFLDSVVIRGTGRQLFAKSKEEALPVFWVSHDPTNAVLRLHLPPTDNGHLTGVNPKPTLSLA